MKKKIFAAIAIAFAFGTQVMTAQCPMGRNCPMGQNGTPINKEQMMDCQANRMAAELMLDDATAGKFKTTYKNFLEQAATIKGCPQDCPKAAANKNAKADNKAAQSAQPKTPKTDAELEKAFMDRLNKQHKMLDLKEKYYKEFRKFLSVKQSLKAVESASKMGKKGCPMMKGKQKGKKNGKGMQQGMQQRRGMRQGNRQPANAK